MDEPVTNTGPDAGASPDQNPAAAANETPAASDAPAKAEGAQDNPAAEGGDPAAVNNSGDTRKQMRLPQMLTPDNSPISDWSAVDLNLPKDAQVDANLLQSFGQAAIDNGLTPNQARALTKWQLDAIAKARSRMMEDGLTDLRKAWGQKFEANQRAAIELISNVDRQLGNDEFSRALNASAATMHPGVCKGLLIIANMLSEDAMGKSGASGMPAKPETALDGIENAFKEMKARL